MKPSQFNLEHAIAEWRQQLRVAGITSPATLAELESHLREEIERQAHSGSNLQPAFETAAKRIGCAVELEKEFQKLSELKGDIMMNHNRIYSAVLAILLVVNSVSAVSLIQWQQS